MMDRSTLLATLLIIGLGIPTAIANDEQLIRELNSWERRAVIVARIGEKQRDTVDIDLGGKESPDARRYERYSIDVLSSITGRCDPVRTPVISLHLERLESYEIPPEGTVVLLAMFHRENPGLNEWLIEPAGAPYLPNKQAVQIVEGDVLALIEKCRSACEATRRKFLEHRDYRIAELEKILAGMNEKFRNEKTQFEDGLKAALGNKDKLAEARVRERMKSADNYYPDVIAVAEKQLAALRKTGQ